jgi:hypothetical protein
MARWDHHLARPHGTGGDPEAMMLGREVPMSLRSPRRRQLSAALLSVLFAMFSCSYGDRDDEDGDKNKTKAEVALPQPPGIRLSDLVPSGTVVGEHGVGVSRASPASW